MIAIIAISSFCISFLFACFLDGMKEPVSLGDGVYIKSERIIEVQEGLLSKCEG